jgi:hypothetical protein
MKLLIKLLNFFLLIHGLLQIAPVFSEFSGIYSEIIVLLNGNNKKIKASLWNFICNTYIPG